MRGLIARPPPCHRNTHAERRVSLKLFVTALTFLMLTAPISVGHLVHTLLPEETVHNMLNQSAFVMTMFAIADLLAYAQHASQFYVCFACSLCFRQALRRQFGRLVSRMRRLLSFNKSVAPMPLNLIDGPQRRASAPPLTYFHWHLQQEQRQLRVGPEQDQNRLGFHLQQIANKKHPRLSEQRPFAAPIASQSLQLNRRANLMRNVPPEPPRCETHVFLCAGAGLLMCRYCFALRFVSHSTRADNLCSGDQKNSSSLTRVSTPSRQPTTQASTPEELTGQEEKLA